MFFFFIILHRARFNLYFVVKDAIIAPLFESIGTNDMSRVVLPPKNNVSIQGNFSSHNFVERSLTLLIDINMQEEY